MKPGIYTNLSNADYHASEGLSSSQLKKLAKSAAHFKAAEDEDNDDSVARRFGTLVHMMILEADTVKDQIFVGDYNTRRGKEFDKAVEAAAGKLVYNRDEYNRAQECVEAFRKQAMEHPYLNGEKYQLLQGYKEYSFYWRNPEGLLLKVRTDCLTKTGVITDIKTCPDATPDGFARMIAQLGYHISAAHYIKVVGETLRENPGAIEAAMPKAFAFVCIEDKAPYLMATYFLSVESLELGDDEANIAITNYQNAVSTGKWAGYPQTLEEISLPKWYSYKSQANRGGK